MLERFCYALDMKKEKLPAEFNLKARRIVEIATGQPLSENPPLTPAKEEPAKNPHAVALGRLGGLKGGKARAKKLTKEQRKEIAKKAAETRWAKSQVDKI